MSGSFINRPRLSFSYLSHFIHLHSDRDRCDPLLSGSQHLVQKFDMDQTYLELIKSQLDLGFCELTKLEPILASVVKEFNENSGGLNVLLSA